MIYDLVTLDFKSTNNLCIQSTDEDVLNWLLSSLDDNYAYTVNRKLVYELPSGQKFRYNIVCREGREALFFLMQNLCHTGWEPIGCSMIKTWVTRGFFRRAKEEMGHETEEEKKVE